MEKEIITEYKDNDEIKQAILEMRKSVITIQTRIETILFIMILPIIIGFLILLFGTCQGR